MVQGHPAGYTAASCNDILCYREESFAPHRDRIVTAFRQQHIIIKVEQQTPYCNHIEHIGMTCGVQSIGWMTRSGI